MRGEAQDASLVLREKIDEASVVSLGVLLFIVNDDLEAEIVATQSGNLGSTARMQ